MLEQGLILIGQILLIIIVLSLYFAPTIYAYYGKSDRLLVHFITNMVSGWSVVGWIITRVFVLFDTTIKRPNEEQKEREEFERKQQQKEEFEKERQDLYAKDPERAKLRGEALKYLHEMDAKAKQKK